MSFSGNPTKFAEREIENDGFWPNFSLAQFQEAYRLPGEYLVAGALLEEYAPDVEIIVKKHSSTLSA